MIFDFQLLEIMQINFKGIDLAFGCHKVVFEWEGFSLESFRNDTSLYIYIYPFSYPRLLSAPRLIPCGICTLPRVNRGNKFLSGICPLRDSKYLCLCVYTRAISEGFEIESFPLKYNLRHPNARSIPLKLIYIISNIYKPKFKCFEYFLSSIKQEKNGWPKQ